ncbi:hypothetical protein NG796_22440 [Laspinema sp. A4]|uniref:hypothetical protein n=1 Tax=Laspinema sp. D2d TaxID=2953686 RepID=UPI0021BB69CF|nr:hypothetical protein [Laspinema sp. D2d]MCT7986040.1 hypothetical protein [Laspinema sp. D2d]
MNSSPNQFPSSANTPEAGQPDPSVQATPPDFSPSPPTKSPEPKSVTESNKLPDREAVPTDSDGTVIRPHPIPLPSEPKQYRAIGLVAGRYQPSEEQFTRGNLITPEGTAIDAVLLGKVMSLVKNHLSDEEDHLWVVYPRTRQKEKTLHVQIMGVWEPEKLTPASSESPTQTTEATATVTEGSSATQEPSELEIQDGYFSIRGEVIFQSQDEQYIVVKIKQSPKDSDTKPKFFKLQLEGTLPGKAVGHFWDLHVKRQENSLLIEQGNDMGSVAPKKKKPFKGKGGKPGGSKRPYKSSGRPVPSPTVQQTAAPRTDPLPKPVKRNKPQNQE